METPSWFRFLEIEADLAMTFIGVASTYSDPEHSAQSLEKARAALAAIQRGLMNPVNCGLSEGEVLFLQQCCTEIESALADFSTN